VKRPTLADIASRAGVTRAVSFALNFEEGPPVLIRRGSTDRAARLPGTTAPRVPV